ncbi:MAG: hypothetical protein ACRDSE_14095 [Pseudonocardiaceae bacterium]
MAVTPGRTGRVSATGTSQGTSTRPSRVVPPGPLPADSIRLAQEAAAQLGWSGIVLPEMLILGRKVHLVVRLRTDVHAERIATGMGPVIDRTAVATWTWPELAGSAPAEAVEIVGVLAVARHWRTALAWAVPFARYSPAAMVLPASVAMSHDYVNNCLPRARAYGLAVLTANDAEADAPDGAVVERDVVGKADSAILAADAISRWINELAYEQLLATAEVTV